MSGTWHRHRYVRASVNHVWDMAST
ncbi:hypothetical protein F383_34837 [Gossypium arboreum]|uniref:Uncharacterized protein n=1 Tax=Gossypium arboreum TaxID=29729 RepID=A0A0B0PUS0_GOSAR|nr:hypothetical protein F383_34837 [Gossypium arboreum]